MRVKILRCSSSYTDGALEWYRNLIGKEFEVSDKTDMHYFIKMKNRYIEYLLIEDCEVIDEAIESRYGVSKLTEVLKIFESMTPEEYNILFEKAKDIEQIKIVSMASKKKPRIPDENTPVDTLVRIRESEDCSWSICHFSKIVNGGFQVFVGGLHLKPIIYPSIKTMTFKQCEIIEETIEEKRARIFHKFVPKEYKWYGVDNTGIAHYFKSKPTITHKDWGLGSEMLYSFPGGFADPYDWENSLIGRE